MICGVDEAGRGPIIGPLVVCGVAIEQEHLNTIEQLCLHDSKKYTKKKRKVLAEKIKKIVEYELVILNADEIDNLRQKMSLNEIEVRLYARVINKLKPDVAYVDSPDVSETRFKKNVLNRLKIHTKIVSEHKADVKYPIVSAASILAKVRRDYEIQKIEKKLSRKIGSGYPSDKVTIQFLRDWYNKNHSLPPCVRRSWKTVRRIMI
jgi:ribonuclease HII